MLAFISQSPMLSIFNRLSKAKRGVFKFYFYIYVGVYYIYRCMYTHTDMQVKALNPSQTSLPWFCTQHPGNSTTVPPSLTYFL